MFTALKKITTKGQKFTRKDRTYLQQLSTGVYCTLSEKLTEYDPDAVEQMTLLRYQSIIVLLCLWDRNIETKVYQPMLATIVNQLLTRRGLDPIPYKEGEYTAFFRGVPAKLFMDACDYFGDQCSREELSTIYLIADEYLQPTNKETKEALGNE